MTRGDRTTTVGIAEARARLSELLRCAEAGEEVVITKAGTPVARLLPVRRPLVRRPGSARGRFTMAADFEAPLDDFWEHRR